MSLCQGELEQGNCGKWRQGKGEVILKEDWESGVKVLLGEFNSESHDLRQIGSQTSKEAGSQVNLSGNVSSSST